MPRKPHTRKTLRAARVCGFGSFAGDFPRFRIPCTSLHRAALLTAHLFHYFPRALCALSCSIVLSITLLPFWYFFSIPLYYLSASPSFCLFFWYCISVSQCCILALFAKRLQRCCLCCCLGVLILLIRLYYILVTLLALLFYLVFVYSLSNMLY